MASMTAGARGRVTSPMDSRMILASGVGGGVGGDPSVDLGKEVAAGQLQIVLVDVGHGETPPLQKNLQTIMAEFCPAVNPNLRATPPRTR